MSDPNGDDSETSDEGDPSPEDAAPGPMMVIMAWQEGDTESTIDDALLDGPGIVGEIAADIAEDRKLPDGGLSQIGTEPPAAPTQRRAMIRDRSLHLFLRAAVRLAE